MSTQDITAARDLSEARRESERLRGYLREKNDKLQEWDTRIECQRREIMRLRPLAEIGAAVQQLEEWMKPPLRYYINSSYTLDGTHRFMVQLYKGRWLLPCYADTLPAAVDAALKGEEE